MNICILICSNDYNKYDAKPCSDAEVRDSNYVAGLYIKTTDIIYFSGSGYFAKHIGNDFLVGDKLEIDDKVEDSATVFFVLYIQNS